ncbi:uncharacterized protein LOC100679548 isoform X1 [Nasonia vitripennis]|uniref:Protein phosphatase 1 regulatory subunit 15A/B C-terminal domain-containing protein n=1 Tax=Nasonia vitripennis TaxID=7425 RepID=A0A7M7QLG3_NASVI|nr:uncharacterized protein LOC100679548 isoform X1 [Nasonia vitripennis]
MDFRHPARSSSESSTAMYASSPECEQDFKAHWYNNMYSAQNLNSPSKLMKESLNENTKNFNFNNSRMYSTKQSLSVDNMANQPKKTVWQSMFRSMSSLVSDHLLNRGPLSFLTKWSSMNTPLSVTVVSTDFYKSWQRSKDHQLVDPSLGFYTRGWTKDSPHSSDEISMPNILYANEILGDSVKLSCSDPSDSDERWKQYKCMYVNCNETQGKEGMKEKVMGLEKVDKVETDSVTNEKIVNSVNKSDYNDEDLESHFYTVISDTKELDKATNFGNTLKVDDEPVMLEKPETTPEETEQQIPQSQSQEAPGSQQSAVVGTMLTQAYNKVVNGMTDILQLGDSSESMPSSLFTKRACSPKPRPKRVHIVSNGRGRGRAKSQLRRSGVSQKRHRKERSRYDCSEDIKNDIDNWEELEYSQSTDDDGGQDVCDFAGSPGQFDNADEDTQYRRTSNSFTLADIKPKKRKPENSKKHGWTNVSVAFTVPCLDEDGGIDPSFDVGFRPRLMSESSVDSEDSYCIVFEGDGDNTESDLETDEESCTATDTESESEDEDDTDIEVHSIQPTKVKFDLNPTVHRMIKWNFAYRAARPGPWEQIARDRERFNSRIKCIGRVLNPVLAKDHRDLVYNERFAE